ncbi:MAG: imidazole glycerol phosphate synthase subunit HisH [Gammaproteobacteria bacterium]|nr:imidazole glycerol phosphate synthase subunit HisH [Gammaproteobacteria bacterium]|tara:strand:- start:1104 stop:1742 length:639 start_codon:yes stop_codon:yes gene_type:complete
MKLTVGVVDFGMGNIQSVINGFEAIGKEVKKISSPSELSDLHGIVLPGVGAFAQGMESLKRLGFDEYLYNEVVIKNKPFLGICLGLQLLATSGSEHGEHEGLNWISGKVELMKVNSSNKKVRIPHIGWNNIKNLSENTFFKDIKENPDFYFVHSYSFVPQDKSVITSLCNHGDDFVSSIQKGNIIATQFHPEKSQVNGLKLLKNWYEMIENA